MLGLPPVSSFSYNSPLLKVDAASKNKAAVVLPKNKWYDQGSLLHMNLLEDETEFGWQHQYEKHEIWRDENLK